MHGAPYFPDKLRLRVPRGMAAALECVARQKNTLPAEWAPRVLLSNLEAAGVRLNDGRVETHEGGKANA